MDIKTLCIKDCIKCDISLYRKKIVNGRGPITSKVMIIGEAPGSLEDKSGIPFVGASGQLLRLVLRKLMIEPKDIYITNIIKCRPLNNRNPSPVEISNCMPNLSIEIARVNPKVILLLGGVAYNTFFPNVYTSISKDRGKLKVVNKIVILPTYHPSYVIRNKNNPEIISEFISDLILFQQLIRIIHQ